MLPPSFEMASKFQQEREREIERISRSASHRPHRRFSVQAKRRLARLGAAAAVGGVLAAAALVVDTGGTRNAQMATHEAALVSAAACPRLLRPAERGIIPATAVGETPSHDLRSLHSIHVGPDVL